MTPVTRGRNDLWGGLIVVIGLILAVTAFAGVSLFQIGAVGFFAWLALARKQGWAWIPAAFFGFHVAESLLDGVGGSLFFPLMVVAAGVLMLSRDRLSKNTTVGILIMLAVVGIASSNRNNHPPPVLEPDPPRAAPIELDPPDAEQDPDAQLLPALKGRELVVLAEDIDLELRQARRGGGSVLAEGVGISDDSSDVLVVDVTSASGPVEIAVPAEASVRVRTTSGDLTADVAAFALDVDTVSGDIEIDLTGDHALRAETADGSISAEGVEDTDPAENLLTTAQTGLPVRLETVTGTISISQD